MWGACKKTLMHILQLAQRFTKIVALNIKKQDHVVVDKHFDIFKLKTVQNLCQEAQKRFYNRIIDKKAPKYYTNIYDKISKTKKFRSYKKPFYYKKSRTKFLGL